MFPPKRSRNWDTRDPAKIYFWKFKNSRSKIPRWICPDPTVTHTQYQIPFAWAQSQVWPQINTQIPGIQPKSIFGSPKIENTKLQVELFKNQVTHQPIPNSPCVSPVTSLTQIHTQIPGNQPKSIFGSPKIENMKLQVELFKNQVTHQPIPNTLCVSPVTRFLGIGDPTKFPLGLAYQAVNNFTPSGEMVSQESLFLLQNVKWCLLVFAPCTESSYPTKLHRDNQII